MGNYTRSRGRGSSSRRANRARLSAVQNARGGKRGKNRRGGDFDLTKFLMYGIAALILVVCIGLAVKGIGGGAPAGAGGESSQETTTEPETELDKQVTVDGVDITGMKREQAQEAIAAHIGWDMKVTHGDEEASVPNLMETKVSELLDEIYSGEPRETYELDTDGLTDGAKAAADAIADGWDVKPKNGGISSFDAQSGKFSFSDGTVGVVINRDKLAADIESAVKAGDYKAVIAAETGEQQPEMTAAQAREKYKTLGTYTTKTTSNKDRNENIRLASASLNGKILQPGEEFSFNDTTGARTTEKGYKPAGAYVNGVLVEEPGGGVCQVSSTLYNAVVFSGLKTTERHAHSYEPSYVTPGEDAMVSYGGPDMKFKNTSDFPIAIRASFASQELTISIYGVQILEDGVKVRMHSEKISELDPPAPTYEEDPTLQPGVEVVAKAATPGSKWTTNLVTSKDGAVVSDEFFHNSTYRGKPATIKRNTSGTVAPSETESGSADPSASGENAGESGSAPADPAGETSAAASESGPVNPSGQAPETGIQSQAPDENPGPSSQENDRPLSPANPGNTGNEDGASENGPVGPGIS